MNTIAHSAAATLRAARSLQDAPALAGFDGFIDTICHAVDKRHDAENYDRIRTLREFGERIAAAAGKSANVEIVPTFVKLGGNGPIMANALCALGLDVTYCGMTGYPNTHSVFEEFSNRARLLPISAPALTDAYEFDDGKLIVGKHATVSEVTYENLMSRVGEDAWFEAWDAARFVAMVNWTMLPYMTPLWKKMLEFPSGGARKTLFFDLADPEKRSRADILDALQTLARFQDNHDVILGLNEAEAIQVGETLDVSTPVGEVTDHQSAPELADAIRAKLEIGVVVVHPTRFAAAANADEAVVVDGPFIAQPKISTGAGDHFNAGFCLGQLLGANLQESLQMGVGTSGFYVRSANSPSREELAEFLTSL